jgi:hypothetical protein
MVVVVSKSELSDKETTTADLQSLTVTTKNKNITKGSSTKAAKRRKLLTRCQSRNDSRYALQSRVLRTQFGPPFLGFDGIHNIPSTVVNGLCLG